MIRGPIGHQPIPGDIPRGKARAYSGAHLMVTVPTLPVRVYGYRNALSATFVPLLVGGQGKSPITTRPVYRGLAPTSLQPIIEKHDPWE